MTVLTYAKVAAVLFLIDAACKIILLYKQDTHRDPGPMAADAIFNIAFAMLGAYIIGAEV